MGLRGPKPKTQEERFFAHIAYRDSGCIEWTGGRYSNGYGAFHPGPSAHEPGSQKKIVAHRWAYEHQVGPIPPGMQLDHLCRNRACVNPRHLEPVTASENQRRSAKARITHCPAGHEYNAVNTKLTTGGHRRCRACERARDIARADVKNAKRRVTRAAERIGRGHH